MNIILFGLPRSGKTTIGQKLAKHLSLPFLDTDRLIEELYQRQFQVDLSCRKIYQTHGEKKFRIFESEVIFSLQNRSATIISIGGGAICNPKVVLFLKKLGELVYLQINKKTLYKRLIIDPPAFLSNLENMADFEVFYNNRLQYIQTISSPTIIADNKPIEEIVDILSRFYKEILQKSILKLQRSTHTTSVWFDAYIRLGL